MGCCCLKNSGETQPLLAESASDADNHKTRTQPSLAPDEEPHATFCGGDDPQRETSLEAERENPPIAVCRPYQLRLPTLVTQLTGQEFPVVGLTKLDNAMYVAYMESDTLEVFTARRPYTQLCSIHVNGLKQPVSLAACNMNGCLYVADCGSHCVWKVTRLIPTTNKWLDVKDVGSLSVTSGGNVVMLIVIDKELVSDKVGIWRGRVDIYSSAADAKVKLASLNLPCDIVRPWHVVQTVDKTFIVCHGYSDTGLHRVCEVDADGVLLKSHGESRGSELGQLSEPVYIALDNDERVFVVDAKNDRILLLNKHLYIQRVLLTWSCDRPGRLFYDQTTTQLMVGLASGKLEIYSLL